MKKGRSLELLVEALERSLSSDPSLLIESPKRIRDIHTGELREHDVLITFSQSHHELLVAIECKDRSRPVGVPDIEAFENKCRSTFINHGIIVSSSGFYKTAKKKAEKMAIRCIELSDIEKTDFLMPDASVVLHSKVFLKAFFTPVAHDEQGDFIDNYEMYAPGGSLITDEILKNNLQAIQDSFPYGKLGELKTKNVFFKTNGCYLQEAGKDKKWPLVGIKLKVTYTYEITESKMRARAYIDVNNGNTLAKIATAKVVIDGKDKEFTLIENENKTTMQFIDHEP